MTPSAPPPPPEAQDGADASASESKTEPKSAPNVALLAGKIDGESDAGVRFVADTDTGRPGIFEQLLGAKTPAEAMRVKLGALFAFMIVSFESWRQIPGMGRWGADLLNSWAYQRCAKGQTPYGLDPHKCGDPWNRPMIYPPVMFRSFAWMRYVKWEAALNIWTAASVIVFTGTLYAWYRLHPGLRRVADRPVVGFFGLLLLLQFPFVFSVERGSADVGAIALWTATAALFGRKKFFWAGAAAGLAAAYRLYPIFPCVIIGVAMLIAAFRERTFKKTDFLWFGGGGSVVFIASNAVWSDARHYFQDILPKFAKELVGPSIFAHTIPGYISSDYLVLGKVACFVLAALWIYVAQAAIAKRAPLVFAGVLAMSTFSQGVSYDYNFTTVYPLFLLLFLDALETKKFLLLAFGLFAICGSRSLFVQKDAQWFTPYTHMTFELAFVVLAGVYIVMTTRPKDPSGVVG